MKEIIFKQNDLKRGIPLAVIYFVLVFAICYISFGGVLGMADAVNNTGSAKGVGFLVGLGVLAPFVILLYLVMPKVSIAIYPDKMIVLRNKKEERVIHYSDIASIQLNVSNLNRLDFIDVQNNIVYHIQPQNKPQVIEDVITELSKHIRWIRQTGTKKYFGKKIETSTYIRRD